MSPLKLVVKGHEDIWYHLPKVHFLNEFNVIFGLGNYAKELVYPIGWSFINSFFNFFNGSGKNLYLISYVFFIISIDAVYQNIKNF